MCNGNFGIVKLDLPGVVLPLAPKCLRQDIELLETIYTTAAVSFRSAEPRENGWSSC